MDLDFNLLDANEQLLEEMAEEIDPYFLRLHDFLFNKLRSTEQPLSLFSTTSFAPKVDSLREGIFITLRRQEFYSARILFRASIEHTVKAQYLFFETTRNKNDQVGIDYWAFGSDQETVNYVKSLENAYKILRIKPNKSAAEILRDIGIISEEKSANLIKKKTEQFLYKKMVESVANSLNSSREDSLLSTILPRYSELSSYVHGGPASVDGGGLSQESFEEMIEASTFFSLLTKYTSYNLIYKYDKEIEPLASITMKYLTKFISNGVNHPQKDS
tara:strand:- start:894 stop:1715 length:822 start_codon:yes stop_codon:yes gene_type:complete